MRAEPRTRTPLQAQPLRVAGQSLSEEIDEFRYDHGVVPAVAAVMMSLLAAMEWFRFLTNARPTPWIYSGMAALAVGYAAFKVRRTRQQLKNLRLGRDAERAVAQYLEWFRTAGFFVFHDVPSADANIDHVLIGTRGVFTIETKAVSKPLRGECKVRVVDDAVSANGRVLDRNPIVQAKAQARWLHNFFKEAQFKAFVQPVVVFPGWFVEPFDMKAAGVWVLEPKALDRFFNNEPERLTRDEVRAMGAALSSYIRAQSALV